MDVHSLQQYLQSRFTGRDDFMQNIIEPIFGDYHFEEGWDTEMLEDDDLLTLAKQTGVTSVLHYGFIELPRNATHIFEVTVADRIQMNRNRVGMQRLVRRLMSGQNQQSAFMIFHYADQWQLDWRFSYCHYGDKEMTTAKRYTFLLGPGQACRTAAQNFCKLFEHRGELTPDDITTAFDVEALSKEFFNKYKEHYDHFCAYVYNNKENQELFGEEFTEWEDKTIRNYVKKLLGRIVFLHFLQKKGWMGVPADKPWGEGDRQFMKSLFDKATDEQKANYLDEVLEPMFNDLDTQRNNDIAGAWCNHLLPSGRQGGGFKIPYLNGGLFERDKMDEPKSTFSRELFSGLFNFLYQYNFTIDENDPNDAEVGVDPEMLGRIFENLLEDNKDKGAFYTPKEIVQYMCRESLIAYLTTSSLENGNTNPRDKVEKAIRELVTNPHEIVPRMNQQQKDLFGDALRKVRICDPAIGSGAFPMGLLNELVRCRTAIDAWAKDSNGRLLDGDYAALKREIVCNNIYGVDIEQGAIDIARLRFWLSIVVDEKEPETLPNLDYKFMKGNSLITTFDGEYVNLDTKGQQHVNIIKMRQVKKALYDLKVRHYNATGEEKHRLAIQIKDTILQLISLQLGYELRQWYDAHAEQKLLFPEMEQPRQLTFADIKQELPEDKQRICDLGAELRAMLKDESKSLAERAQIDIRFFDWRMMFTEVFEGEKPGFDIVIGNPPYIKEYTNREAFDGFRDASPYYIGKMDLWYGFACHGIDLLSNNGVIAFIAQNNWTTSAGASIMRNKVITDSRIIQLLDFNDYMVFGEASIQTMIMIFRKNNVEDGYLFDHRKLCAGGSKEDMLSMLQNGLSGNYVQLFPIISREAYLNTYLTFSVNDNLLRKLVYDKSWLQTKELAQGIVFPQDFLNKKGAQALGHHNVGDGIFGLTTEEKDGMCLSPEEDELIKPYYTTDEIGRYYTNPNNHLWMIYTDSSYKNADSMDSYPALKNHIDQFLPILTSDNKPYGLHRARNSYFFKGEKIIVLRKCVGRPCFSYNDFECYVTQTFYSIKTERWSMKFLTGVLNSKLIAFWLKHRGKMQGENYQLDKEPLLNIPLPLETCEQQPIITLVNKILSAKKANPLADTTTEEREIDRLVYELYGLTNGEVKIIDPNKTTVGSDNDLFKA